MELDNAGSVCGIKVGSLDGEAASDTGCTGCKRCIVNSRRYVRQTVSGYKWEGQAFCFKYLLETEKDYMMIMNVTEDKIWSMEGMEGLILQGCAFFSAGMPVDGSTAGIIILK